VLTKPVNIDQSEGIPESGVPKQPFVKNAYGICLLLSPSLNLVFLLRRFFVLHPN
jgi:hypothetical protein